MKLRTKKSFFKTLPEGQAPKRFWPRVMKFFYFMLLLSIAGGMIYLVAQRFLYFKGNGQVEIEKRILSSRKTGTVITVNRGAGDAFLQGEILAVIDPGQDCRPPVPEIRPIGLAHEIKRLEAEHKVHRLKLEAMTPGSSGPVLHRALDIGAPYSSRKQDEQIQKEQERLMEKTAVLAARIRTKKNELADLKNALKVTADPACELETIRAPFNGVVFHITRKKDEFINRGDPLMVVIKEPSRVFIDAYVDWTVLKFVKPGETMSVRFPDGTQSLGRINRINSAAAHTAELVWKNYQPVESKLKIKLTPENNQDNLLWKRFDRMDVLVTGERK